MISELCVVVLLAEYSKRKAGAPRSSALQDKFGDVDGDGDSDLVLADWGQERQLFIETPVNVFR
jgi:hypothetical protein